MDGRWSLWLAGGVLGGLLGCAGLQPRPPAETPPAATPPVLPPPSGIAKLTRPKAATPAPAPAPQVAAGKGKLKPSTLVSVGALKEQAAEEAERPQPEREAARQQARQSYQKAIETDPKYVPGYVALAKSYALTGETELCAATFEKAKAIAPND